MFQFLNDFKKFAMRGNVVDMAIGVIIGAAFGKIVSSMVSDIIMPPIGLLLGKMNFSNMFVNLSGTHVDTLAQAQELGLPIIGYGAFINTVIDFLIQAFVIFLIVRQMNRFRPDPPPPMPTKQCPYCMTTIDDRATRCPNCTSDLKG